VTIGYFSLSSSHESSDAIATIYEKNVKPQSQLLDVIDKFNSIGNNLLKVLNHLVASEGAKQHLLLTNKELLTLLSDLKKSEFYQDKEMKKSFDKIAHEYEKAQKLIQKILQAYKTDDKKALQGIAFTDWSLIDADINREFSILKQSVAFRIEHVYFHMNNALTKMFYDILILVLFFILVSIVLNFHIYRFVKNSIETIKDSIVFIYKSLDLTNIKVAHNFKDELSHASYLQDQSVQMQTFLAEIVMVYVGFHLHLLKLKVYFYKMKELLSPQ